MSIILNEQQLTIPEVQTTSWLDPEAASQKIKQVTDKSPRSTWVRGIVCHTIHGKLGKLLPGNGVAGNLAERYAQYQTNTDRSVSWDYTCDLDGSWIVQNDPTKYYTWHATSVNGYTCGFEMVQLDNGDMYEEQIAKAVRFIDFITAKLGIQRQIPWDMKNNCVKQGILHRIAGTNNGKDVIGVYAHYHQTTNRGKGDPGPWIFNALKNAGYELFDFDNGDDKEVWKARQKALGFADKDCDGVPGPATVRALKAANKPHGIWVPRPIDLLIK
mgnify:CR=1 FL=1|jgi:hypothetical protein